MYDLINAPLPKLPKSVKLALKAKEECLMKKSVILCMVAVMLISVFVGCSVKSSEVNKNTETSSFSASKETTLHISTAEMIRKPIQQPLLQLQMQNNEHNFKQD